MFIGILFIPVSALEIQKKQNYEIKFLKKETTNIKILDYSKDKLTVTEKTLSSDQAEHIIKAFFETDITEDSFYKQAKERIKILQENELISSRDANILLKRYTIFNKFFENINRLTPNPSAFDIGSILNLIIFGLKGEKESLIEILFPEFEFFNGTIAGRFSLIGKWGGHGFVFSLGILGFKYIYEFDQNLYPEFPHLPEIEGLNLVFIGILIDIYTDNPDIEGRYYLALGTTLLTVWNKL